MKQFANKVHESESRPRTTVSRPREKGYILLTLLLIVALMGIFALAAASTIDFEIRRDRELEMIHRGVQYSRAIRAYYKKFQRYPTKLDDLDNTNNLRYLRKHYKDPLNKNGDFRLLHYGEQGVTLGGGFGGGTIPGATPVGSGLNGSAQSSSAFGGSALGGAGTFGSSSGVNSSGVFAQSNGNSSSGLGASSNSQTTTAQGMTPGADSDPTQATNGGKTQGDTSSNGQPLIASGPIVGVASISKKDTIREFNKKRRYNEWQFVYDPAFDRGGLITTPYQPSLQNFGSAVQNNLQPAGTTGQSGFGQSGLGQSGLGQSSFGSNSSTSGSTTPAQPSTPSQQQQ